MGTGNASSPYFAVFLDERWFIASQLHHCGLARRKSACSARVGAGFLLALWTGGPSPRSDAHGASEDERVEAHLANTTLIFRVHSFTSTPPGPDETLQHGFG